MKTRVKEKDGGQGRGGDDEWVCLESTNACWKDPGFHQL